MGDNKIDDSKNAGKLLVFLITMRMRWCKAGCNRPMKHIKVFTRSHWMPPLVK
jgi:hypothetical protein